MKTFKEQILEEFDENFWPQSVDILYDNSVGSSGKTEMVKNEIKSFISQALDKQIEEVMKCLPESITINIGKEIIDNLKKSNLI